MTFDAVIVGGGPAGATAALMLASAGWSVAVIEKASFPRRKVCGEFISATSLPVLDELGLDKAFRESAGPEVRRVALFAGDSIVASPLPQALGGWGRALGREHLDSLLLEAAVRAGAKRWQPAVATELQRTTEGTRCTIVSKSSVIPLSARVVILAHGSWERGPLPAAARPRRAGELLAFKAHFRQARLPSDLMPLVVFPGGYGGMVHSDGGRLSLSCCIRRDALNQCRARYPGRTAGDAVLAHIKASCVPVRDVLEDAPLDGNWLSAGPIRTGIRSGYAGGVYMAGNLAGEAHPIVAEGISMAMQSAWLLCRSLIANQDDVLAGRAQDDVGYAYAAVWRRHFSLRVRSASVFAHLAMRPTKARPLLSVIKRFPALLTLGAELSGKAAQVVAAT